MTEESQSAEQAENLLIEKNNQGGKSPDRSKQQPPKRLGVLVSGFLFLVIFSALGGSAYLHWRQYQSATSEQLTLDEQTQSWQRQFQTQQEQLQQARADNQTLRDQLQQQQQRNDESRLRIENAQNILAQQLEAQNQRLLQMSSTNSANWELAEALYLTRLANQRLAMEQNREAALALLEGADTILARQQNPELFPIRDALSRDITALNIVEAIDREGLFLRLSALHEQLQHLPLAQTLNFQPQTNQATAIELELEDQSWWQKITGSFSNTFGQLDNYVRKIDLEGPATPILTPEDQHSIRLAITLYLESAQIALLRAQPLVYKNALQQAQQQLIAYYPETSQRQELVLALQSLQGEAVKPSLPDISQSYLKLNEFIQTHGLEENPAIEVQP